MKAESGSLPPPQSFGEIALTGDNRRSAGVVAFRRTILLCLHKRQYLETMSKWMEVEVADKKRVLLVRGRAPSSPSHAHPASDHGCTPSMQATPLFCDLPADEIDSLVRDAALRKAGASADLVVEGQPLDEWFVVATGVLRVLRFVDAEEELPVDPQTGRPCAMVGEMSRFSHYGAGEVVFGSMHAVSAAGRPEGGDGDRPLPLLTRLTEPALPSCPRCEQQPTRPCSSCRGSACGT